MRASNRHHALFLPRLFLPNSPQVAAGSWEWAGGELVPAATNTVAIAPASMLWTGAAFAAAASTTVTIDAAEMLWTGAAFSAQQTPAAEIPALRWLVRMGTPSSGTKYMSVVDVDSFDNFYEGRILEDPPMTISRSMREERWGVIDVEEARLSIDIRGGFLAADAPETQRGQFLTVDLYDEQSKQVTAEWSGLVKEAQLHDGEVLDVVGVSLDTGALDTRIPTRLVDQATFPKAVDLGRVVPVVFGNVAKVPLLLVREDFLTNTYDYMIGHGTLSVAAAYRNGPNESLYPIHFFECLNAASAPATSWANACRTDLYAGFTVLRFPVAQLDFSGGRHQLCADVIGLSFERNFSTAIRTVLENTAWGLGKTVNASSFISVAGQLNALGSPGLFCDGAMVEQEEARTILTELCMPRELRLGTLPDATTWTLSMPTPTAAVARALVADDASDGERSVLSLEPRTSPGIDDAISRVKLAYRENMLTGEMIFAAERTVQALGRPLDLSNRFIANINTADRVADFIGKRLLTGQTRTRATLAYVARALRLGDVVTLTKSAYGFAATLFELSGYQKVISEIAVSLRKYAAADFTYAAGTLPTDPNVGTFNDLTRVAPAAVTGFVLETSELEQNTDGVWLAKLTFRFVTPAANYSSAILRHRKNGTSFWTTADVTTETGTVRAVARALITNQIMDFTVGTLSPAGIPSATASNPVITLTTPRDQDPPLPPTALTLRQSGQKGVELAFTYARPADFDRLEVYRALNAAFTVGATTVASGDKTSFHDQSAEYDTLYYYRGRGFDTSGNGSGGGTPTYSPVASILTRKIETIDLTPGSATTPIIAPGAVNQTVTGISQGGIGTFSTTGVTIPSASVTLIVEAGDVGVEYHCNTVLVANNQSPDHDSPIGAILILFRDGIELHRTEVFLSHSRAGSTIEAPANISGTDLAGPGSHTYSLKVARHPAANASCFAVAGLGPGQGTPIKVFAQGNRRRR